MPGPVLQILGMSYHDLLNSLKDLKMQVFLPYFVRKAKGYYNAQLLDYWGGKNRNLLFWFKWPQTLLHYHIYEFSIYCQ